jgi:hypothetical protein
VHIARDEAEIKASMAQMKKAAAENKAAASGAASGGARTAGTARDISAGMGIAGEMGSLCYVLLHLCGLEAICVLMPSLS